MTIVLDNIEDTVRAAREFIAAMGSNRIFAFRGEMGAGKTTFISEVCRQLGVHDVANSPSFSIVNEYVAQPSGDIIYHFDFYRIDSPQEALEIGIEEYFYSGRLCLIEWPDMIDTLLPEEAVEVKIHEEMPSGRRVIEIADR